MRAGVVRRAVIKAIIANKIQRSKEEGWIRVDEQEVPVNTPVQLRWGYTGRVLRSLYILRVSHAGEITLFYRAPSDRLWHKTSSNLVRGMLVAWRVPPRLR